MHDYRYREEVMNVALADILSEQGVKAHPETIQNHGQHRPDVLFPLRGLRIAIEGKTEDVADAENIVLDDARQRVRTGIAHIAVAVLYPIDLRSAKDMATDIQTARLRYRIITEASEQGVWDEGNSEKLMESLRRAQDALAQDDIVEQTAQALNIKLSGVTRLWTAPGQQGTCDRLCEILGIIPPNGETLAKAGERRKTAAKVAALVLANALIFQEQLATTHSDIAPLRSIREDPKIVDTTLEQWRYIEQNINYVPIFQIGHRVLEQLPSSGHTRSAVKALLAEAIAICDRQTALRHDLMGRVYHWLLHYAKYLGTYYTSVSAATLLLKLAFAADWQRDFGDIATVEKFRVADLACGTGTLLMATTQAFVDEYIHRRIQRKDPIKPDDLSILHRTLMESSLYGYDVLPSAIHLTASTLALLAPEIAFVSMNLYAMPMGIDHGNPRLGSLDFLGEDEVKTQMTLDRSQAETVRVGAATSYVSNAKLPKLDLCVINPPFTRSGGDNLLFGSLPDDRGAMQSELRKRTKNLPATATAGLGSVFVALADKHLRVGGRLAFVLPAALASGEAWRPTRKLLADSYHLETVILSHDAHRPNFSENTELSEILFIARKCSNSEKESTKKSRRTRYINLWRNPHSVHEALYLANEISDVTEIVRVEDSGITSIHLPSEKISPKRKYPPGAKIADMVTLPVARGEEIWCGSFFAQVALLRICWHLEQGKLRLPGVEKDYIIAMTPLRQLGDIGYNRRDIVDAFETSYHDWSPYPAFWGHDAKKVTAIAQNKNAWLLARTTAAKGRHLKSATTVWSKAGRILLVERVRTNTQRLIAIGFAESVLGNTWWALDSKNLSDKQNKALLLFLNSSFTIALCFARRVITHGAWVSMKKAAWLATPILDVRALDEHQLDILATAYDDLAYRGLAPLAQLDSDMARIAIDEALCTALNLPSLAPLRGLLAREPGLTGHPIAPK